MKMNARLLAPLIVVVALANLSAQQTATLSIETLMATPFPTELVAAPSGGRIAWVSSHSGVHNVLVAEPVSGTAAARGPTDHKWRAVTSYTGDDGLWITDLAWTSDARTLVYVAVTARTGRASRRTPRNCRKVPTRPCTR